MLVAALEAMRERGGEVKLYLPETGPLVDALRQKGLEPQLESFPVLRKSLLSPLRLLQTIAHTGSATVRLARTLKREAPDLVYVNTVTVPVWLFAAHLAGIPAVVHVREAEETLPRWMSRVLMAPVRLATFVVANSQATASWISQVAPSVASRTQVIYNGFTFPASPHDAVDSRRRPQERAGGAHVVLVGRLSPRKAQDVAIRAWARTDRVPGSKLHIAGSAFRGYEWYEDEIRALASELCVEDAVEFHGFVEDVAPLYEMADVALVPSLQEPFGNVAVEAMALGLPVIASRVGGLEEIVTDGRTGLLVEPGDVEDLARAITRLLDDAEFGAVLGATARSTVRERFDSRTTSDSLWRVLEGTIRESSR